MEYKIDFKEILDTLARRTQQTIHQNGVIPYKPIYQQLLPPEQEPFNFHVSVYYI